MSEEIVEKVFQVSGMVKLMVKNIRGTVEIHPGEESLIQVTAVKKIHTGDNELTKVGITQETDGIVKAETHFPNSSWNWLLGSRPCEVDYVVKAPLHCSLKLDGVINTVLVDGFNGEVNINSVSGDITLHDLSGPLRIHTVSADVDAEGITGTLELDTVSGDVTLRNSDLHAIRSISVSGDIQITTPLAGGPYGFKSVSGDVHLNLPPETHCTGELHSLSGDLISAFLITGFSHQHGTQLIKVGNGGVIISMRSVSGDLSLDCDRLIPTDSEQNLPTVINDRRALLELLDRGDLSVDEALVQLHSLEKTKSN